MWPTLVAVVYALGSIKSDCIAYCCEELGREALAMDDPDIDNIVFETPVKNTSPLKDITGEKAKRGDPAVQKEQKRKGREDATRVVVVVVV